MTESQLQISRIDIDELRQLDTFVKNRKAMDEELENDMDTLDENERFVLAAKKIYGTNVDQAAESAEEGQPGFLYAEARRKIRKTLDTPPKKVSAQPSNFTENVVENPKPVLEPASEDEEMVTRPVPIQKAPGGEWRQSL